MTTKLAYRCTQCGNTTCEPGEAHITGGFFSKMFDVEGRKFTTLTCTRCRHTAFFQADRSVLSNIFDLMVS